jgi:hypothetical protein
MRSSYREQNPRPSTRWVRFPVGSRIFTSSYRPNWLWDPPNLLSKGNDKILNCRGGSLTFDLMLDTSLHNITVPHNSWQTGFLQDYIIIFIIIIIPWPKSASELYRPSDRRLSAKSVPTFAVRECRVVSATDPYGSIFHFISPDRIIYSIYSYIICTNISQSV